MAESDAAIRRLVEQAEPVGAEEAMTGTPRRPDRRKVGRFVAVAVAVVALGTGLVVWRSSSEPAVVETAAPESTLATSATTALPAADPYALWGIPAVGTFGRPWAAESLEQFRDWSDTVIVGRVVDIEVMKRPEAAGGFVQPGTLRYLVSVLEVVGGRFYPTGMPGSDGSMVAIDVPVPEAPGLDFDVVAQDIIAAPRSGRYLFFLYYSVGTNPLRRLPAYQIAEAPDGLIVDDPEKGAQPPRLRNLSAGPDLPDTSFPDHEGEEGPATGAASTSSPAVAKVVGQPFDAVVDAIEREPGPPRVEGPKLLISGEVIPLPDPDPSWPRVAPR